MVAKHTALLTLLLVAALPAAAEARTYKVDGRVTGPPTAKRGTVTVPLQLTARAGRALKLGTRRVRVRFRRARLPLVGAARRVRIAPRALRNGDRLRGVTKVSKKTRRRLRYRARPALKLRRVRVVRASRRRQAAPFVPAPPVALTRTPAQVLRDIGTRATNLSVRIGRLGSFTRQIERLQTLRLPLGLASVTAAFESLRAALEERASTEPAFEPLLAELETVAPGADWLGTAVGAVNTSFRTTQVLIVLGDAVETLATDSVFLAAHAELFQQIPGVLEQLVAIEEALGRVESGLAGVEAASGSLGALTTELNDGMGSLADAAGELATAAQEAADPATLSPGIDALAGDVAGVGSDFGALQASLDQLGPALDSLHGDAQALSAMVEALEGLGMGAG